MAKNEALCAYAAMVLSDGEKDVTADNINTLCKAAGASVPAYYAQIFEKVNAMRPVSEILENAGKVGGGGGGGGGAAPAAGGGGGGAAAAAKKESSSDDDDGAVAGGGLFGDEGDDY